MSKQINGEQLRAEIDAGRTGDKVAFPDPAAAPLETDAEAGGAATRYKSERRDIPEHSRNRWDGLWLYGAAMAGIAIIAVLIVRLAA